MTKRKIHPFTLVLLTILATVVVFGFISVVIIGITQGKQQKKEQAIIDKEDTAFKKELFDNTFKSSHYFTYKDYDNRQLVSANDLVDVTVSEFGYVRIFISGKLEFKGFLNIERIRSNDKLFIEYSSDGGSVIHPDYIPIAFYKSKLDDYWYLRYGISHEFRLKIVKPYS